MKPFCSGGTQDADILLELLGSSISREALNPHQFPEPLAPLVAARNASRMVPLDVVVGEVKTLAATCDLLLVEGAGGLLAPLGESPSAPGKTSVYDLTHIVSRVPGEMIVVAANKLGVVNHTLLTLRAIENLRELGCVSGVRVVLMAPEKTDESCTTNEVLLRERIAPLPLFSMPFLGREIGSAEGVKKHAKFFKKTLAAVIG
jgi:dethiobiotin synthase